MRPDEPKSFDPHDPVDITDAAKVQALADRLEVEPHEIVEAVREVGDHPVAVAIYLGSGAAAL